MASSSIPVMSPAILLALLLFTASPISIQVVRNHPNIQGGFPLTLKHLDAGNNFTTSEHLKRAYIAAKRGISTPSPHLLLPHQTLISNAQFTIPGIDNTSLNYHFDFEASRDVQDRKSQPWPTSFYICNLLNNSTSHVPREIDGL